MVGPGTTIGASVFGLMKLLRISFMKMLGFGTRKLAHWLKNKEAVKMYPRTEIKYLIDEVIQRAMFESDETSWDVLLDVQVWLKDAFGIED